MKTSASIKENDYFFQMAVTWKYFFSLGIRHILIFTFILILTLAWMSWAGPDCCYIQVNLHNVSHYTDEKFLSFALDTSFLNNTIEKLRESDWKKLTEFAKPFSPCYLRLGGKDADRLIFGSAVNGDYIKLTPQNWAKINEFTISANLSLLFGFNALLRDGENWDPKNSEAILNFSKRSNFKADYQLGNEPNSFPHVFNYSLSPEQLAKDYRMLRNVLNTEISSKTLLVGPDVTRPKDFGYPAVSFLNKFLNGSLDVLDAVTWHQYYVNGRNTSLADFLNPLVMDRLYLQSNLVTEAVRYFSKSIPIWLGETGSAFGGGAPGLSDRFSSTFLLLDKLGLSARLGISVVVRQSFFQGHYALIDNKFQTTPDFWVSLLYKKLVGNAVYDLSFHKEDKLIRAYSHDVKKNVLCLKYPFKSPSTVLFGMNLGGSPVQVKVKRNGREFVRCATYSFTPVNENLQSSITQLNGKILNWDIIRSNIENFPNHFVPMEDSDIFKPYSLNFWVLS